MSFNDTYIFNVHDEIVKRGSLDYFGNKNQID